MENTTESKEQTMDNVSEKYITPTKEFPVFTLGYSHWGWVNPEIYNDWRVFDGESYICGVTYALNLTEAIKRLHKFIRELPVVENDGKFKIIMIDGSIDRRLRQVKHIPVYSITGRQARRYRIRLD